MKEKLLLCFFCMSLVNEQTAHAEDGVLSAKLEASHVPHGILQAVENIAIKGKVVSGEDGEALPGVTVMVKGSTSGTVTDIEGNYSMMVPKGSVLVFSFVGFNSEEVTVGDQSTINVSMIPDLKQLDEVVVVGYGEQKRANLTGSVVQIDAEEIQDLPVANLSQALIGRLAGVKVSQSTGKPGEPNPLTIRTTSSIKAPETILYVIDGVIFEENGLQQFSRLDASEIQSISILKDAAAAVYGARASGGVVLVTTKKGKVGKPRISYSSTVGIGSPTQLPEMMSAYDHAILMHEIYDYQNGKYRMDPDFEKNKRRDLRYFSEDELLALDTLGYDWLDGLYKDAFSIRHTLNVSGGTEDVRYFVGGSYYKETGNIDNLLYRRYSVRANVDANLTKDLNLSLGINTNTGNGKEPYSELERSSYVLRDTYRRLLTAPRWMPPTIDGMPVVMEGSWNPYGVLQSSNYKSDNNNNTTITGALEYKVPLIEGLKAKAQYSYNLASGRGKQYVQDYYEYVFKKEGRRKHLYGNELIDQHFQVPRDAGEGLQQSSNNSHFYQFNAYLTYNRSFNKHNIDALLVYEQSEREEESFRVTQGEAQILGYDQAWAFTQAGMTIGSNASESGRLAYIGRLNYNYNEKYLFESAFRYEASQKFHPDYAWGFFPSLSAGWVISEEEFFNSASFLDFLKLRASAGRIGNQGTGAFQWKQTYGANTTGAVFGNTLTNAIEIKRGGVASPTISWQKTNIYNVGVDTRFLDNRINFTTEAYYRYTYDILVPEGSTLPVTVGVPKPPDKNYGIMTAKGLEFSLGFRDNIGRDFEYSVNGVFSYDKRQVLRVYQNPAAVGSWYDELKNDPSNQPGWIAGGIIRTEEDLEYVKTMYDSIGDDDKKIPVALGMIWYKDIRGENWSDGPDGKLDRWDRDIIARYTSPPFNYGLSLGFGWKGLKVDATFSGAFGHKVFVEKDDQVLPTAGSNVFAWWGDYWTPENPNASLPRPYQYGLEQQISTFWMRDGTTMRLNNINVSYALPTELLKRIKLPQFRVYVNSTNLWTIISPFEHKDPSISRAYDYPLSRTYNIGLNISL